jgi:hypothetical protein
MNSRFSKPWVLEAGFALLFFLLLAQILLREPIIGLADHGDYFRVMSRVGLSFLSEDPNDRYYWHLNSHFGYVEPEHGAYFSSQVYLTRIAVRLDNLLTKDLVFVITSLGALHALLFTAALTFILRTLRGAPVSRRVLLGALFLLICGDVAYIAWFNSLYSESASLIFLAFTVALALTLANAEQSRTPRWRLGAAYYIAALLFLTAKPQNGPCGLVLVPLGYILTLAPGPSKRRLTTLAAGAVPGILLLTVSAWMSFGGQPDFMRQANLYNVVFGDLLKHSPNPRDDMVALGVYHPDYLALAGKDIYENHDPIVDTPEFKAGFYNKISYGKILKFYAARPLRFYKLIDRCTAQAYTMRPPSMGNYTRAALERLEAMEGGALGDEPVITNAFTVWSDLKKQVFPRAGWFLLLFLAVNLAVAAVRIARFDKTRAAALASLIHVALALMAALQFCTAIIGEGTVAIVKHLFLFNALFDALLIVLALNVTALISEMRGRRSRMPL